MIVNRDDVVAWLHYQAKLHLEMAKSIELRPPPQDHIEERLEALFSDGNAHRVADITLSIGATAMEVLDSLSENDKYTRNNRGWIVRVVDAPDAPELTEKELDKPDED